MPSTRSNLPALAIACVGLLILLAIVLPAVAGVVSASHAAAGAL